jgi:hypothetical protein
VSCRQGRVQLDPGIVVSACWREKKPCGVFAQALKGEYMRRGSKLEGRTKEEVPQ